MSTRSANPWAYKCVGLFLLIIGACLIAVSVLDSKLGTCDNYLTELQSGVWSGATLVLASLFGLFTGKKSSHFCYSAHFLLSLLAAVTSIAPVTTGVLRFISFANDTSGLVFPTDPFGVCYGNFEIPDEVYKLPCPKERVKCCNSCNQTQSDRTIIINGEVEGNPVSINQTLVMTNYDYDFDFVGFVVHHGASLLLIVLGSVSLISTLISTTFCCGSTTLCGKPKEPRLQMEIPRRLTPPAAKRPAQQEYQPAAQNFSYEKPPQANYNPGYGNPYSGNAAPTYAYANQGYDQVQMKMPRTNVY